MGWSAARFVFEAESDEFELLRLLFSLSLSLSLAPLLSCLVDDHLLRLNDLLMVSLAGLGIGEATALGVEVPAGVGVPGVGVPRAGPEAEVGVGVDGVAGVAEVDDDADDADPESFN